MFIKTENEGVVGISLKKDFKVFVYSGGYKKQIPLLAKKLGVDIPHQASGEWYDNQKSKRFEDGVKKMNDQFLQIALKYAFILYFLESLEIDVRQSLKT